MSVRALDPLVPPSRVRDTAQLLNNRDAEVELKVFDRRGHGFGMQEILDVKRVILLAWATLRQSPPHGSRLMTTADCSKGRG